MTTPSVQFGAATDVGRVRDHNEDQLWAEANLAVVADGVGGHAAGEVASAIVISHVQALAVPAAPSDIHDALIEANTEILNQAADPALAGMGTTAVAASIGPDGVITVFNVGDSRAYLRRGGKLSQITVDHTYVTELIRQGELSAEEARRHPNRNLVTRVLGLEPSVRIDRFDVPAEEGDRLMLCSDGLNEELTDNEINEIMSSVTESGAAATALVDAALARGGRDNVTVVVVDVGDLDGVERSKFVACPVEPVVTEASTDRPSGMARRTLGATVRLLAWLAPLALIAGSAYVGLRWYATSTYFADTDAGEVVIYRGRPDGVLWFEPAEAERTGVQVDGLVPAEQARLEQPRALGSLEEARMFVRNLADNSASATAEN